MEKILEESWSLIFGNGGKVTKEAANNVELQKFIKTTYFNKNEVDQIKGVVTAIYFVSGGLTFPSIQVR